MVGVCDNCGNNYDKTFVIRLKNKEFLFDCFECAIHKLAPVCTHCNSKIIGHSIEIDNMTYCCNHCANQEKAHRKSFSNNLPLQFTF